MTLIKEQDLKTNNSKPTMGHQPALDGLRAIAVILVLLTHANFQLGDNGILGVDMFFTLSGFLITTLLLEEYQKRNKISLKAFYVRRTFRLFPALYAMLLFVFLYAVFFRSGEDKISILGEVLSSALYLNNISWVWGWGNQGLLLGHTWSLAVEEQFYLLWPWFVIIALSFKSLRVLSVGLIVFIVTIFTLKVTGNISSIAKSLIHEAIFIGCLAAILRWTINSKYKIPDYVSFILIGFMIIVGVLPIKWYMDIHDAGGRSIMAVITAIVIITIVNNPQGFTSKLLSSSPMVWIGKISYALYLWHVPIFRLFKYHSTLPPSVSFILKFIITFLLAGLSWILIEKKATDFGRTISRRLMSKDNPSGQI